MDTHQKILRIALPMIISSMSVPLLGMVDTALLGHLDSAQYLGAAAIGANFIGLMYWSFGFLRMSTTGLVAQSLGQHRSGNVQSSNNSTDSIVFRALSLGLLLGIAVFLLIPFVADTVVHWMQASEPVSPLASEYIAIRRYSAPAVFMTFAISGWLVGTQQPQKALILVLFTNISNIVLDVIFIVYLDMKTAGAARATVIAEYAGLILGLWMALQNSRMLNPYVWRQWLDRSKFAQMLGLNYHLLIRTLLLLFVFNFFTAQGSAIDDEVLAANAILLQLVLFSAFFMDGFSYAAEALCGEAYGGRHWAQFKRIVSFCGYWMGATAIGFAAVYAICGIPLISLFSDVPGVLENAAQYHAWLIVLPVASFAAYLLDGIGIGTAKTHTMHYSMWFSTAVVFLPSWWLFSDWGNHGLWLAFALFSVGRSLSLGYLLNRSLRAEFK